jgi:ankyrin repeat protein
MTQLRSADSYNRIGISVTVSQVGCSFRASNSGREIAVPHEGELCDAFQLFWYKYGSGCDRRRCYFYDIMAGAIDNNRQRLLALLIERSRPTSRSLAAAADKNQIDLLTKLIDKGGNINEESELGAPLNVAARHCGHENGYLQILKFLLSQGADVNVTTAHWPPLYDLVASVSVSDHPGADRITCASLLLERGADINWRRDDDETLLHRAAYLGDYEMVKFLVSRGADVNAVAPRDVPKSDQFDPYIKYLSGTPADWAEFAGRTEVARYLRERR